MENDWNDVAVDAFNRLYHNEILPALLEDEMAGAKIYPPKNLRFRAFEECSYANAKVVILGQDPYHGPHQANGLAFDVDFSVKPPPSLVNILKEKHLDVGASTPGTGSYLAKWAKQGVLLLNTSLSVLEDSPESHIHLWKPFTKQIIQALNKKNNIVWALWGLHAQGYSEYITNPTHKILKRSHPSPFSARKNFIETKPFSQINQALQELNHSPIDW